MHTNNREIILWLFDKRKLVKFTAAYLQFQSFKETCGHIKCVPRCFHSEAENLKNWYCMQANPVDKGHCVTMQIFIKQPWGETWHREMENCRIWLVQTRRFTLTASKSLMLRRHMLLCSISVMWKIATYCEKGFSRISEKNMETILKCDSIEHHIFTITTRIFLKKAIKIKRFKAEVFPDFLVIDKNALIPTFQLHLNGKISVRDYCAR